jgi:hypothetical protein
MRQQGISGWRGLLAGSCHTWPLPADATCAAVARQVFRDAVSELGLEPGLLDDSVLMASELAANTLHARPVAGAGGGGDQLSGGEPITSASPAAPILSAGVYPELWLYLRGLGVRRELVCKIFDASRGWRHGSAPSASKAPVLAAAGRGLQIVHELSDGRWGYHATRARVAKGSRGKAVWFAVPAPLAHARLVDVTGLRAYTRSADVTAARANARFSARQAASELETMLSDRGFPSRLERADQPAYDLSVLSVSDDLTVRCRSGVVSLTAAAGPSERWNYADLVEAAEQTVRRFEELDLGADLAAVQ